MSLHIAHVPALTESDRSGGREQAQVNPAFRLLMSHWEMEHEQLHRRVEIGGRDGWPLVLRAMRTANSPVWGKVETDVCVESPRSIVASLEQNCLEKVWLI